ncbi:VCBS repeat-containing protein [Croceitalea sp. P059]|uniref:VCBS repeat-containing protein n=1 Tax=Croceitalea sp. P059 TaxID=3075601 RepID=UPI00288734C5|nr:VCBS repeat-containing protein [Croceitalea sp. P059]MDT0538314.1 VCBS repeat-containing protein [Croceitalea sp. P059]
MNKLLRNIFALLIFCGCKNDDHLFKSLNQNKTGIDFVNTITESNELNILDYLYFYNGGGVAIGDINNDDLPDIFFTGNQVKNKLYLNKGNLQFEDISMNAQVEGKSTWNTGVTMADVNGDGYLDIYVCAVVGINGFNGYNELYINNQDNTFTESSTEYGLDFDSYSSNAAFFDYDLDGDLDLYLLNHAVHTQNSYGNADLRNKRNYQTGDKLLRNDNGQFKDVSEQAGIFGGINAYGLGLAVSDFNLDGYPDLYIGNDFHEDDYYYLNNGDGSFTESLKQFFGHTSRFSMGSDVADINHDGRPDMISLDMLPEDETVLKSSEGDDNVQIQRLRTEQFGYHYQFTRNMLYVNQPDGNYLETALLSGVAATDWSWSALFGDYDLDGEQDLFVANGISKRPNDLDFVKFVSNDQIQKKIDNTKLVDQKAIDLMPSGNAHNYIFKGHKGLNFEDMSGQWMTNDTIISGATAMADLDGDGDLDLVTNNINTPASIYLNQTNQTANHLKIKFNYGDRNVFGIGTKVYSYHNNILQYKELFPTRGFQASSEPFIHFGYGDAQKVDSIRIVWPNKTFQVITDVAINQTLIVKPEGTEQFSYHLLNKKSIPLFKKVANNLGIEFEHQEDSYNDFLKEKLMPYKASDRGPAVGVADLNLDGQEDIFFGGSRFIPSQIYIQKDSGFTKEKTPNITKDSIKEDISIAIADFNGDHKNDILLGSGGAHFTGKAKALLDSYYIKEDNGFSTGKLPDYFQNASVIRPFDYDNDGDLDVFIGGHTVSSNFGQTPESVLLVNENGTFSILDNFIGKNSGMVTDAVWDDFDKDGVKDLIVVGEWFSPKFYKNLNGELIAIQSLDLSGLWQTIEPFDIDNDGDTDYLLGNWGTNSKFNASIKKPLKLYVGDFDKNGQTETITAIDKNGAYYPLEGLDELSSQMVSLRKKYTNYRSFAGQSIEEILGEESMDRATILKVTTLQSGYLKNNNGVFNFIPFSNELQVSPILKFLVHDFDGNGDNEVLIGGNYFGVKPYQGRFDSFPGAILKNENEIILGNTLGLDFTKKSIRHLNIITFKNKSYLLATFNDAKAQVYEFETK